MSEGSYNFGLITTSPINIGEEIQSLAAMRFLPQIDEYIHREHVSKYRSSNKKLTKLIMNAWWMWRPKSFPPAKDILPLLVSMYFRVEKRKKFLTEKTRKYLIEKGPVGCRDTSTYEWLKENNIPAYFSGCLTLTLKRSEKVKKQNYILCVDIAENVVEEIKKRTNLPVYHINVDLLPVYSPLERIEIAKIYLRLYQEAHCVVSNRLHVILPCLAFDTPVLKLDSEKLERHIRVRYSGYEDFAHVCSVEDFLSNKNIYDFNNPPKNPQKHLELAEKLVQTCTNFTGFDNNKSFVDETENPFFKLLNYSSYSTNKIKGCCIRIRSSYLLRTFISKVIFRKKPYDKASVSVKYQDFK